MGLHAHNEEGEYEIFRGTDGLIDACMTDGWNEMMDAFHCLISLAALVEENLHEELRVTFFCFCFFLGHEDYGFSPFFFGCFSRFQLLLCLL